MLMRDSRQPHEHVFVQTFANWRSSPIFQPVNPFPFSSLRLAVGLHSWYAKEAKMPGSASSDAPLVVRDRLPGGIKMLRIHRLANGEVVFTLSGRLDQEHIAELDALVKAETGRPVLLDLKDMTLAGQEGIDFLAQCEEAGIALVNCAPYVREWIARQRSGS